MNFNFKYVVFAALLILIIILIAYIVASALVTTPLIKLFYIWRTRNAKSSYKYSARSKRKNQKHEIQLEIRKVLCVIDLTASQGNFTAKFNIKNAETTKYLRRKNFNVVFCSLNETDVGYADISWSEHE